MKRMILLLIACCWLSRLSAQTYEQLWRKVEDLQKQDLPVSVLSQLDCITAKAKREKQVGQLMKAFLWKYEIKNEISPDSAKRFLLELMDWERRTTTVGDKAMLNLLVAYYANQSGEGADSLVLMAIRAALKEKAALDAMTTDGYRPLVKKTKLSEILFRNSLLELIFHQVVRNDFAFGNKNEVYNEVIRYYEESHQWNQALAVRVEQLQAARQPQYMLVSRGKMGSKNWQPMDTALYVRKLDSLRIHYPEVEAKIYVYDALSRYEQEKKRYDKAMQWVNEVFKHYATSPFISVINQQKAALLRPSLVYSQSTIYPGKKASFYFTHRNLKGVRLDLYRLAVSPLDKRLRNRDESDMWWLKEGQKVLEKNVSWSLPADYREVTDTVEITMPEEGMYGLLVTFDTEPTVRRGRLLNVLPYAGILMPATSAGTEMMVVDADSGKPLSGIKVGMFQANYTQIGTFTSDTRGKVVLPANCALVQFYKQTPKTAPNSRGWIYDSNVADRDSSWQCHLYTDRGLYRPGQKVEVAGVFYGQLNDELKTLEGRTLELRLMDTQNWKVIDRKTVKTDDFGSFHMQFDLPRQLMTGMYQVVTTQGSCSFSVEEYKRPQFEVKLQSLADVYKFNDSISMEGVAETFSGVPVRGARGKYRLTAQRMIGWSFDRAEELAEGEITTDEEGHFILPLYLKQPAGYVNPTDNGWMWGNHYRYRVSIDLTDAAGETHEAVQHFYVSDKGIIIGVDGIKDLQPMEQLKTVQITMYNLAHQKISGQVSWTLLRKQGKTEISVAEGTAKANQSIDWSWVKWTVGNYLLRYENMDSRNKVAGETPFSVFSLHTQAMPDSLAIFCWSSRQTFAPGQTVEVYVGTSHQDVHLFSRVYAGGVCLVEEDLAVNNEVRHFTLDYNRLASLLREKTGKPDTRLEGISVLFTYMKKGLNYTEKTSVKLEEPDKKLELKWRTFRDKLQPGQKEVWTLTILKDGKPVDARFFATLYDASLNQLMPFDWEMNLYFYRHLPSTYVQTAFPVYDPRTIEWPYPVVSSFDIRMSDHFSSLLFPRYAINRYMAMGRGALKQVEEVLEIRDIAPASLEENVATMAPPEEPEAKPSYQIRRNLNETAFFYPALRTDTSGGVRLEFTMPEALTTWRFIGFAHTRNMDFGFLREKAVTQKKFMVQPQWPRYFRDGDRAVVATTLQNLYTAVVRGKAQLTLLDPATEKILLTSEQPFEVDANRSGVVRFEVNIGKLPSVVIARVVADGMNFSDGEQTYLAVRSNRQTLTETLPFQVKRDGQKLLDLTSLKPTGGKQPDKARMTVEMTANPVWYAIQALPALAVTADKSVVDYVNSLFANTLSAYIAEQQPHIRSVVEAWSKTPETSDALISRLQANDELKQFMLEESPWLSDAEEEAASKRTLAWLFDKNWANRQSEEVISRMRRLQQTNGSYAWYPGMQGSTYLTAYVGVLLARMQSLGLPMSVSVKQQYDKLVKYLRNEMSHEVERMKQVSQKKQRPSISETTLSYLYMAALDRGVQVTMKPSDCAYVLQVLKKEPSPYSIYDKARMAIIMKAFGENGMARNLVNSLKQYLVHSDEMGSYYDSPKAGYSWMSYRIPTQVAAMEAIRNVQKDEARLDDMALWLLKQKQVQRWESPVASASAVYALLQDGRMDLQSAEEMQAMWREDTIRTSADALGYVKQIVSEKAMQSDTVRIVKNGSNVGWGSIYYQYETGMADVEAVEGQGLRIRRTLLLNDKPVRYGDLHVGDRLTVQLNIDSDRDMDFVQLTDERAVCMEPVDNQSVYEWKNGWGYYRAVKDAATVFFIERMRKGSYTIRYEVYLDREGTYSLGAATIQSAYSPEFTAHTGGGRLTVTR